MKKILTLTFVVLLLALALVACGGQTQPTVTEPAHVHTPGAWVTITAPSCKDGEQCQFCATCGKVLETAPIAATGVHKEVVDEAVAPTCTKTGLTEGLHCMSCGVIFVAQIEIPKIAHSYDDKNDATCNTCDFVRDVTCKHTDVTKYEAKAPTCTEAGITEGIVCNGCEEVLQAQTVINALGHDEIIDTGYAATCTTAGLTDGKHCDRCGEVLVVQSYIKALGHKESDWVIEKAPTETEDGYKYKTCSTCKQKTQEEVIPFIGDLGLEYTVNADGTTCTITGIGTFAGTVLNIPDYIRTYKVTAIGDSAFSECTQLTEINLPETIKTIGTRAFYGCTGITEMTIPASVTDIGTQIFYKADNLNTVYYNSTYVSYSNNQNNNPFLNLSHITKVVFNGASVPSYILEDAKNITEVVIGDNVKYIGEYSFYGCSSLSNVEIPDSVRTIYSCAFYGCSSLESVTIGNSVNSIIDRAFYSCSSLKTIEIPNSVTSIGYYVFGYCTSLESVTMGNSVKTIKDNVFTNCSSLKDVYYMGNIKDWLNISFGSSTSNPCSYSANLYFNGELVTNVEIPDSVSTIGKYAFDSCNSITSVVIPDSVTYIDTYAFGYCHSLESVVIPDSVLGINNGAFDNCSSLTNIEIPDSVLTIGEQNRYDVDFDYVTEEDKVFVLLLVSFIDVVFFPNRLRFDAVKYYDYENTAYNAEFLSYLANEAKAYNEKVYFVGECWDNINGRYSY